MVARRTRVTSILEIADLLAVSAAFVAGMGLTLSGAALDERVPVMQLRFSVQSAIFFSIYIAAWHAVLRGVGLYNSYRLAPAARELSRIGVAVVIAGTPIYPLGKLIGFNYANTSFPVAFMALAFLCLTFERSGLRLIARAFRRHGMDLKTALVIGDRSSAARFAADLREHGELGYRILDVIDLSAGGLETAKRQVDALSKGEGLDEIFVVLPLTGGERSVREIVTFCEEEGITVHIRTEIADLRYASLVLNEIAGQPVLSVLSGPRPSMQTTAKRAIDILGAALGLMLFFPFLFAVAIAIKLDSRGSVIFTQTRVGQNRRRFSTYKFRTMVEGAEGMQDELEHLNEARGPAFKIKEDPRLTRIGRQLRRTSIDEIPQLVNVLFGDMSLVGPRPLPVRDVEKMDVRWHKRRFAIRPGITCLWQANSREPNFNEWMKSDMDYIDRWSLKLDLIILLRTIPAVLTGRGAY